MFAALRRDWEPSESRRDSPAVPLAGRRPNVLDPVPPKKSSEPAASAPRRGRLGLGYPSLSPTAPAFNLAISHKYLNHRQFTPSAWGYSPRTSRTHPMFSLTSTAISLRSAPEDSWLGDQGGQLNNNLLGQTPANGPLLQIPAQSPLFNLLKVASHIR